MPFGSERIAQILHLNRGRNMAVDSAPPAPTGPDITEIIARDPLSQINAHGRRAYLHELHRLTSAGDVPQGPWVLAREDRTLYFAWDNLQTDMAGREGLFDGYRELHQGNRKTVGRLSQRYASLDRRYTAWASEHGIVAEPSNAAVLIREPEKIKPDFSSHPGWENFSRELQEYRRQPKAQSEQLWAIEGGEERALLYAASELFGEEHDAQRDIFFVAFVHRQDTIRSSALYVIQEKFYRLLSGYAGNSLKNISEWTMEGAREKMENLRDEPLVKAADNAGKQPLMNQPRRNIFGEEVVRQAKMASSPTTSESLRRGWEELSPAGKSLVSLAMLGSGFKPSTREARVKPTPDRIGPQSHPRPLQGRENSTRPAIHIQSPTERIPVESVGSRISRSAAYGDYRHQQMMRSHPIERQHQITRKPRDWAFVVSLGERSSTVPVNFDEWGEAMNRLPRRMARQQVLQAWNECCKLTQDLTLREGKHRVGIDQETAIYIKLENKILTFLGFDQPNQI